MKNSKQVAVGSRTSPLALAQTEEILAYLRAAHPDIDFVVVPITPDGDRRKSAPLLSMERGMFVKEIEIALLDGEIDFAVHSAKDLTTVLPDGLVLAAFGQRQDPRDVLVNRWGLPLAELPPGARLGTSSPRRTAQLKAHRPDIEFLPIRGNVGTRLEKARSDEYDGVVVAASGMVRLSRQDEISEYISPNICIPDAGQGALAVEARASDGNSSEFLDMLAAANHKPTSTAVTAERSFLETMGGGCKVPIAAYARIQRGKLHVSTMAAVPDGSEIIRAQVTSDANDPKWAGRRAAEALMGAGAKSITARGATL